MGVTEILAKIAADGAVRVAAVTQECDRQLAAIRSRSDTEVELIRVEWADRTGRDADAIVERARGGARLQQRNAVLAARWLVLDQALDRARQKALSDKDYAEAVSGLVRRQARADSEVFLSESDVMSLASRLPGVKLAPARIAGGAIIRTGKMELNFSLEEMLKSAREELAADLSRALFGD